MIWEIENFVAREHTIVAHSSAFFFSFIPPRHFCTLESQTVIPRVLCERRIEVSRKFPLSIDCRKCNIGMMQARSGCECVSRCQPRGKTRVRFDVMLVEKRRAAKFPSETRTTRMTLDERRRRRGTSFHATRFLITFTRAPEPAGSYLYQDP